MNQTKTSMAAKRSMLRYQKTLAQFSIRLKHEDMARYKAAAEAAGMSFRSWVLAAIEEKIGKM